MAIIVSQALPLPHLPNLLLHAPRCGGDTKNSDGVVAQDVQLHAPRRDEGLISAKAP